jgi:hypothetical protein
VWSGRPRLAYSPRMREAMRFGSRSPRRRVYSCRPIGRLDSSARSVAAKGGGGGERDGGGGGGGSAVVDDQTEGERPATISTPAGEAEAADKPAEAHEEHPTDFVRQAAADPGATHQSETELGAEYGVVGDRDYEVTRAAHQLD